MSEGARRATGLVQQSALLLTRRGVLTGVASLAVATTARAQGFAGLGRDAAGFATVTPDRVWAFPADHGAHTDFRIEWWYVTANLKDATGDDYGVQWTLFRQAMAPATADARESDGGWASRHIWMGHAAVTRADSHRYAETFSRGGIGTAGVTASPLNAWIDAWQLKASDGFDATTVSPITVSASGTDFDYALMLRASQPLVLQGDRGTSKKSERGQASYYYSQPFYEAAGRVTVDGKDVDVTGAAWLDREWSSQPLASDQTGWDWFSLHLGDGDKLMLFRLRQTGGANYFSGNWIGRDGVSTQLPSDAITMSALATTKIGARDIPTSWRVGVPSRGLRIDVTPLNPQSWMGTNFPYWEGPIRFSGSHSGMGYLEMTGY
jgi:predicted secreted hydrolase